MSNLLLSSHATTVQQAWHALQGTRRVLIGTHEHPDGDAVGSSLALWHVLRQQGKEVVVYVPDAPSLAYAFLPGIETLTTTKPEAAQFDAIVLLDYTQLYRTHLEAEYLRHPLTICIDHHYDNPGQGQFALVVAQAAATAHILAELFKMVGVPLTRDVATCLLTGIFTDTGSFVHDSTTPDILNIAAELMSRGARLSHIAHETYQKKDLPSLRIWGRALSRILINAKTGAAVSLITAQDLKECEATLDDLSGVVNMLNTLPQTKFALLLCEYQPGKIKGSLRSEPHKGVDVSQIAKRLGGGGHKLASGFEVDGHIVEKNGEWRIESAQSHR
jgi:phosphoesterase RecJ-like protein